jgi:hypothetical protein
MLVSEKGYAKLVYETHKSVLTKATLYAWLASSILSPFCFYFLVLASSSNGHPPLHFLSWHDILPFFGGFLFMICFFGVFAGVQILIIACPAILYFSRGPKLDSEVAIGKFIFAGSLCAAIPWTLLLAPELKTFFSRGAYLMTLALIFNGAISGYVFGRIVKSNPSIR